MNRIDMLQQLSATSEWDICIIGGGATGLGTAVDAATRGYKTLLLEGHDFAKGTSSRSTKLVHGGVRYLQQGNIKLVMEALHERGLLLTNAPHLTRNLSFIVPNYKWWEAPFYGLGLKVYDWMSGKLGLGPSELLNKEEVLKLIPTLDPEGLRGGVIYHDGQFDDARLAINLAQTAADHGACVLNYCRVTGLTRDSGLVNGLNVEDTLGRTTFHVRAKAIVNATGIFADEILNMDNPQHKRMVTLSQGVHIVIDQHFMPGNKAIMVPKTDDGRVLFAVPWHNKIIVGTTDTPVEEPSLEPVAMEKEIEFIMHHISRYLTRDPEWKDIRSVFAGLRPLVKTDQIQSTASLSREHTLFVSDSGLITVTGGKWTTYRKMAMDTVNMAEITAGFQQRECITQDLAIHGAIGKSGSEEPFHFYGSDAAGIQELIREDPARAENIHPELPYTIGEVVWAIRHEMPQTIEDILSRRTRSLLLDARAAMEAAPLVARVMAEERAMNADWVTQQISRFNAVANNYLPHGNHSR